MGPRCINGELVRPTPPRDDSPSTACQASIVCAPGGVRLGKAGPPCFGSPPGTVPSRRTPPPPPAAAPRGRTALLLLIQSLIQCSGHLFIPDPRVQEEEVHQKVQDEKEQAWEQVTCLIHPAMHTQEEEEQVPIAQEEEFHQEEIHLAAIQAVAVPIHVHRHLQVQNLHSHQEEQVIQAALHRLHLQQHLQPIEQ